MILSEIRMAAPPSDIQLISQFTPMQVSHDSLKKSISVCRFYADATYFLHNYICFWQKRRRGVSVLFSSNRFSGLLVASVKNIPIFCFCIMKTIPFSYDSLISGSK
jgi:hypothetical protein